MRIGLEDIGIGNEGLRDWMRARREKKREKVEKELRIKKAKAEQDAIEATFPSGWDSTSASTDFWLTFENKAEKLQDPEFLKSISNEPVLGFDSSAISDLNTVAKQYKNLLSETLVKMKEYSKVDNSFEEYKKWLDKKLSTLKIKGFTPDDFGVLDINVFLKKSTFGRLGWNKLNNLLKA